MGHKVLAGLIGLCLVLTVDARSKRLKRQVDPNSDPFGPGSNTGGACRPLPAPTFGTIKCGDNIPFYRCTAQCNQGYIFETGDTSMDKDCDMMTGQFFGGSNFPKCKPICSPQCQNGGTCISPNTCACAPGWRGSFCEQADGLCAQPTAPGNGSIQCRSGSAETRCTINCAPGFKFTFAPAPVYTCTPSTSWSPAPNFPECIPVDQLPDPSATPASHGFTRKAMCAAWGQDHYRTFDNKIFSFQGKCEYVLAKDCDSNTFHIHVINDRTCSQNAPCHRSLDIYMGDTKISLKPEADGPAIYWGDKKLAVPNQREKVVFQKLGHYIIVSNANLGFNIRWDGRETVFVSVAEEMRGKTCGLCGTFDGNKDNDFTTDIGRVVSSVSNFATTWKKSSQIGQDTCPDSPQKTCSSSASAAAQTKCDQLKQGAFLACNSKVDPTAYIESCKSDCCDSVDGQCTCSSFEAYARACMDSGLRSLNWRTAQLCPAKCPSNLVHKECGSSCELACGATSLDTCSGTECTDGCYCPDGMVLNNDTCVRPEQCPCKHGDKYYQPGQTVPKDCNRCTCTSGSWQCTNKRCEATCSATGDPHYMTFDGIRYNFMGICSYQMVQDTQSPDFGVIANNIACGHGHASCTKSITLQYAGHTIEMGHNHELTIDNKLVTKLPYQKKGIKLYMVSSLFMKAELSNGVTILWDGRTRAYITAPTNFFNRTRGMCGTFDHNQNNEFLTKSGDIETDINSFGNKWKLQPLCRDETPGQSTASPCETDAAKKSQADKYCRYLKGDVFSSCHSVVDYTPVYENCMYDVCACTSNLGDCLCPMLGQYAQDCAAQGIDILWRNHIPECHLPCPGGQEYQQCPNECTRSCQNIAKDPNCVQSPRCAEGCGCPANQTLNELGDCIDIDKCPCTFNDQLFPYGSKAQMDGKICTCENARWTCVAPGPTHQHYNVPSICNVNEEYTKCKSECPVTCENMHQPPNCPTPQPDDCEAGCKCKEGYVLEGTQCVKNNSCPCYHGGKAYFDGDKYTADCNECTCKGQQWSCTSKECPAVCSAFGDSHYHTFDGKDFEFQGSCTYVMAKSTAANPHHFQITTENVPCGTSGVACTKSITFTIGKPGTSNYYTLQLIRGKPIIVDANSPFNIQEVGNFFIITTPTGITLTWDKGTRLYIKLSTDHKGQVMGLCGNFDGDRNNDFSTPQGGPVAVNAIAFADSWKVQSYCAKPEQIVDTCVNNSQRKPWAQRKCGIINSDLFEPCHHVVPPANFYSKCLFDACACDTGGDCECLCTAIAAYAHECAVNGMPIAWRTKELCAIQCEDCQTYNPCISACPKKTCDNRLVYDKLTAGCQEICVEGCDIKPCASGEVFDSNIPPMKCIPEPFCNNTACTINGKSYRQNEQIHDSTVCREDCEICYCDAGEIRRNGFCSSTTPTTTRFPPVTYKKTPSPVPGGTGSPTPRPGVGGTGTPTYTKPGGHDGHTTGRSKKPRPTTAPLPTMPPMCVQDGWTGWMSNSYPTPLSPDDMETVPNLRKKYTFCADFQISAIQCRAIGITQDSQQTYTCDARQGLICRSNDQTDGSNVCDDFEVRFFCNCDVTPKPGSYGQPTAKPKPGGQGQPTPSPKTDIFGDPVTYPKPVTDRYGLPTPSPKTDIFGYPVTNPKPATDIFGNPTPSPKTDIFGNPVTNPKPATDIFGNPTPSPKTDIFGYPVTNPKPATDIFGNPTPSPKTDIFGNPVTNPKPATDIFGNPTPSPKTDIFGNPVTYPKPVTDRYGLPTPSPKTDIFGNPVTKKPYSCKEGWSVWMNNDTPTKGQGDFETIASLRYEYSFCAKPQSIQCRTVADKMPVTMSLDGGVICDANVGLVCRNADQSDNSCEDYEVSVYCDCGGSTPEPHVTKSPIPGSTTHIQGVPYAPVPACQWTPWMNSHVKTTAVTGEFETISNLRLMYSFCEYPVKIECRDAASKTPYDKTGQLGVSCDVNRGLLCDDLNQNSASGCLDYEVRVYCADACQTPGSDQQGSPTPSPKTDIFGNPITNPVPGSGQQGSPTPSPKTDIFGNPITNPVPGSGQQGSPTPSPKTDQYGNPITNPVPGSGQQGSPTPSPKTDIFGNPITNPVPGSGQQGSPTPSPKTDEFGNPITNPVPGSGQQGSPTPSPKTDIYGNPITNPVPGSGQQGSPTPSPKTDEFGNPITNPVPGSGQQGSPTPSPKTDIFGNPITNPVPGSGQQGSPTPSPKTDIFGNPITNPVPGSGQQGSPTPSPKTDIFGNPITNPVPGSGQQGSPTPSPKTDQFGNPITNPVPGSGQQGKPTPSPKTDKFGNPITNPVPGSGQQGSPTPSPKTDQFGNPITNPVPGSGQQGSPTPSPKTDIFGNPITNPVPGSGQQGSPTPSPKTDIFGNPITNPVPGSGQQGSPTPSPKTDIFGNPITNPVPGSGQQGSPTPSPKTDEFGNPITNPVPGSGQQGSPTPSPKTDQFGNPITNPVPGSGQQGSPTPSPKTDEFGNPVLTATTKPAPGPGLTPEPDFLCREGWTKWINSNKPTDNDDDIESVISIPGYPDKCHKVIAARCSVVKTGLDYKSTGQDVSCNVNGLVCKSDDQQICEDYQVQYYCICFKPTPAPKTDLFGNPVTIPKPNTGKQGTPTPSPKTDIFGNPIIVSPGTSPQGMPTPSPGTDIFGNPYTLPKPSAGPQGTPTSSPKTDKFGNPVTLSQITLVCNHGWTTQMNADKPTNDGGDFETFTRLRRYYSFCHESDIVAVKCTKAGSNKTASDMNEKVRCDSEVGLECFNKDQQDGMCEDYQIQTYCDCRKSSTPTPSPTPSATPSPGVTNPANTPTVTMTTPLKIGNKACDDHLGVANKNSFGDHLFSASSSTDVDHDADKGRLNGPSAWEARYIDEFEHVQVNLDQQVRISGVKVQGHPSKPYWVTKFIVEFSNNGDKWSPYIEKQGSEPKVFKGNFDQTTPVQVFFDREIPTTYVRIIPKGWHQKIAMRFEVLACTTPGFTSPGSLSSPVSGQQGTPTPSPKTDIFGNPITNPVPGSGQQGSPTPSPKTDIFGNPITNPVPGSGQQGSPTPSPKTDIFGNPITNPVPGSGQQGSPTPSPKTDIFGNPITNPVPGSGQQGSPTPSPKTDQYGNPITNPVPGSGQQGSPTPSPKTDQYGNPITNPLPGSGQQGSPTPSPKTDIFGNPITNPVPGSGQQGSPTPSPKTDIFGNPITNPVPGSGQQGSPTPSPKTDEFGNPITNPVPGSGQQGSPTPSPKTDQYGNPITNPVPGSGQQGSPTPSPKTDESGNPITNPVPGSGQQGSPTPSPKTDQYGNPITNPVPGSGQQGSPTPSPKTDQYGNPITNPVPGSGQQGSPTPSPKTDEFGNPITNPVPGSGQQGSPTPSPKTDEFGNPITNPVPGSGQQGSPTPSPKTDQYGNPITNPVPGSGQQGSPTPSPKTDIFGNPITNPVPGSGQQGSPTPSPKTDEYGSPAPIVTTTGPCVEPLGIDNSGMIQDKQLSASSRRDILSGAAAGRLFNEYGAWIPRGNDGKDWIEVDLLTPKVVSGVMTQGSPREERWVTKYGVSYSIHGYAFSPVIGADGKPVIFNGNTDQNKVQKNQFPSEITARYIRITPVESSPAGPGMRFNLIGCSGTQSTASPTPSVTPTPPTIPVSTVEPVCMLSMGVENPSIITDRTMLASSSKDSQSQPDKARLDLTSGTGHAWIPSPSDKLNYPYIEVNFLEPKSITGIVTRGHGTKNLYTKSFRVYTSLDGIGSHYVPYNDQVGSKSAKTFTGNSDKSTPVTNLFNRQVIAKFVRIFPMDFEGEKALQFNVLGCNPTSPPNQNLQALPTPEPKTDEFGIPMLKPGQAANQSTPTPSPKTDLYGNPVTIPKPKPQPFKEPSKVCLTPMGLENVYIVTDVQISASSSLSPKFSAEQGRIFNKATSEHGGAWVPSKTDSKPWIQVDFNKPTLLSGVVIQGEGETNRYVTSYTVSTSVDSKTFTPYMSMPGSNVTKVFKGNADNKTPVRNLFNRNITAQVIRIYPSTSSPEGAAIRFNILGCFPATPAVVTPAPGGTDIPTPSPGQGGTAQPTPKPSCDIPLGITNKAIVADTQLTASSILDGFHGAERGRIYTEKDGSFSGGWTPSINNKRQWIQVDFLSPTEISGILTQGRSEIKYWVTKYQVYYSTDGQSFSPVTTSTTDKTPMVFDGNKDRSTPVKHNFPYTVIARYVRVVPVEWQQAIGLRFELIGCNSPTPSPLATTPSPSQGTTPTPVPQGPATCLYWTPWVNTNTPDKVGDYETAYRLNDLVKACPTQFMKKIECRDVASKKPHDAAGDQGVKCNLDLKGLVCMNSMQANNRCLDYEIRVFCDECGTPTPSPASSVSTPSPSAGPTSPTNTPTPSPGATTPTPSNGPGSSTGTPTPSPTQHSSGTTPCVEKDRWSPWINRDKPSTGGGDRETMTAQELARFCPGNVGVISKIECQTTYGIPSYSSGDVAICDKASGFVCYNSDNFPVDCQDYQIRYLCHEICTVTKPHNNDLYSPKPGQQGTPTPSPKTDQFGNPVTNPKPGTDRFGNPTPSPKTDQFGNPVTNPKPGTDRFGNPTPSPKTDQFGNPVTNPKPGTDKYGNPTPSPKTDQYGNPITNPVPGSGQQGTPTPSPKTDEFGNPITNPKPETDKYGNPTPSPKTDQFGKPVTNPVPGSGQQGSPTPSPKTDEFGNPILTRCSQSRWSPWINKDNPDFNGGDREVMTDKEKDAFCADGRLTKIECQTAVDSIPSYSSGEQVTCDRLTGLTCNNADNFPVPCSDYKIRYYCDCKYSDLHTTRTKHREKTTSNMRHTTTAPPVFKQCGWSTWLNSNHPGSGLNSGDFESIGDLKAKYGLCKEVREIECRVAGSQSSVQQAGQDLVTCDARNGLRCYNRDQQTQMCHDYEVRVFCWADNCNPDLLTTPTPQQPVTHHITPVCAPGEVLEQCGHRCNQLCDSMSRLTTTCQQDDNTCVPMCKPAGFACQPGERLKDKNTCVQESLCPCRMQNGTVAKAFESWRNPYDDCEVCHCFNNTVTCTQDTQCVTTPQPTPPKYVKPIIHPRCDWTYWMNVDTPLAGDGDEEIYSALRVYNTFCDGPVEIECRQAGTKVEASLTGQRLTCDLDTGLRCLNWENPNKCHDYEVRFFCPCASTVSPVPGQQGNPTPSPKTDIFGNPVTNPKPVTDKYGNPTPSPKTDIFGNPVTNPKPVTDQFGNPTPSPKTDIFGNPVTNPKPGTDKYGNPTPSPKTDIFGNPVTNPKPVTDQFGNPTPSPKTDIFGNPVTNPNPGTDKYGNPTPSPKTDIFGNPVTNPKPGTDIFGNPTPSPKTDIFGNPVTNPKPGTDKYGNPTPSPKTDIFGNPVTNPKPVTDKFGNPTPSPKTDQFGNPVTNPKPGTDKYGNPTPSPKTDAYGNPITSNHEITTLAPTCGWSSWINMDSPYVMKPGKPYGGDIESIAALRESVCRYEMMTKIECRTAETKTPYKQAGEVVSCDRIRGLRCRNSQQTDKKCLDYEVRVYCNCTATPTPSPSSGGTATPTPSPKTDGQGLPTKSHGSDIFSTKPVTKACGWTTWMNGHRPDSTGETEVISKLRSLYKFCDTDEVTAIECRESITGLSSMDAGQDEIVCDVNYGGLVCDNSKQGSTGGQCYDYEIRLLCEPKGVVCSIPVPGQQGTPTPSPKTDIFGNPVTNQKPVTDKYGNPTPSPKTDIFGNPITNPVPGSGQQGSPTPSPKTDQYGNPITNPVPGSGQQGSPTPSPKTDQYGNPITNPVPGSGQQGSPTPSPKTDIFGNPITNPVPGSGQQGSPTPSPKTDQYGNPITNPVPGSGQQGSPTPSPKTDQYGNPISNPVPGSGQQGSPTPSPKTDQYGNPITNPVPGSGQQGSPTPSPKTDQYGNPITNPVPGSGQQGSPTPSPKTDQYGNPISNPVPGSGQQGSPTPSPKTDQYGNPITNPVPGSGQQGSPTPSPKTDQYGNPITNPVPGSGQQGSPTPSPKTDQYGNPITNPVPGSDQQGSPTPSPKTDIFGNPITNPVPGSGQQGSPTPSPKTDQYGNPITNPVPGSGQQGSPTPSPKTDQYGNPITNPVPGSGQQGSPTPSPKTDQYGNPITNPVPGSGQQGSPTPSPKTDQYGNPITNPVPGSGQQGSPTPSPKTDQYGNPITNPVPGSGQQGSPTPSPKTDQYGNPITNPVPGSDQQGSPTPSPKTDQYGNPITNPVPGSGQQGSPTPSPKTDQYGNPITNPVPGSGQQGSPTPSPKTDQYGNPITNPVPGSGQQGSPTPSPKTDQYGNPITNPVPGSGQQGSPTPSPKTDQYGNPITNPVPGSGQQGSPTPSPKTDQYGNPITNPVPGSGQQGSPTPSPKTDQFGNPVTTPTQAQITTCATYWSTWINENHPSGNGDKELSAVEFQKNHDFCRGGSITKVECYSNDMMAPSTSTGEILKCTVADGLVCNDADNYPVPCTDYKIRYFCDICSVVTPVPGSTPVPATSITVTGSTPAPTQPPVCVDNSPQTNITVSDDHLSASTSLRPDTGAQRSHPDLTTSGSRSGGWIPSTNNRAQWIMVDFSVPQVVYAVTTQGVDAQQKWVTSYYLMYSNDGKTFTYYQEDGQRKIFSGNFDSGSPVTNYVKAFSARYVRLIPQQWQGGIGLRWQFVGCQAKVTASPPVGTTPTPGQGTTPSATPTPGVGTTPTPTQGTPCVTRWSKWINRDNPVSDDKEVEAWTTAEKQAFCPGGKVNQINCTTVDGTPSYSTGEIASCYPDTGFTCENADNFPIPCSDYKISYFCECTALPTPSPTPSTTATPQGHKVTTQPSPSKPSDQFSTTPTPPQHKQCKTRWSDWINKDNPTSDDKEHEFWTDAEKSQFCPGGKINKINCTTIDGTPSYSTGEIATCYPDSGFTCNNADNFPIPCSDYKISYFCQCAPTAAPTVGTTPVPGGHKLTTQPIPTKPHGNDNYSPSPTPSPRACKTEWSQWIDKDIPDTDGMEHEYWTYKEKQAFCPGGNVTKIECVTSDGDVPSYSSGEILNCYVDSGLVCNNADNFPVPCSNYKVRYYCQCSASPTLGPTPSPTGIDICKVPMGVKDGTVRNELISASSFRDANASPHKGRLNANTVWMPSVDTKTQYIQVDFLQQAYLTGVTTQGRHGVPTYVTSYYIKYSSDGQNWNTYSENGQPKTFQGNFDSDTPVTHFFTSPVRARYMRINPQTWQGKIALRFEYMGCPVQYPTTAPLPTTPTPKPVTTPTTATSGPTTPGRITDDCIEYDTWVNVGQNTPQTSGDREPIDQVKNMSLRCRTPIRIQCQSATGVPYDQTGQIVTCNLWEGLTCNNADQFDPKGCMDYRVRLGCLKQSPECVKTTAKPTTTVTAAKGDRTTKAVTPLRPCYPGLDTSRCPTCPDGQFCDGLKCVSKDQCTCIYNGKAMRPMDIITGTKCESCQCFGGLVKCIPKTCPDCASDETKIVNMTSCSCECQRCKPDEFRCGNGQCIPAASKCDGVIDCGDDEKDCIVVPAFTPPVIPTPSPKSELQVNPTVTTRQHHDGVTTKRTKPGRTTTRGTCTSSWSPWVNSNSPDSNGEKEMSAQEYKVNRRFCVYGNISKVECYSVDMDAPSYSTGEIMECSTARGVVCNNADNFPVPCTDYKIRYYCDCGASPNIKTTPVPPTQNVCLTVKCQPLVRPPVKAGEVLKIVKTDDGCCDRYEAICKPETCNTQPITCTVPKTAQTSNPGECCPQFQCVCPSSCPVAAKPTCKPGQIVTLVDTDCGCTAYACISRHNLDYEPPVCRYTHSGANSTTYKLTQSWTDGPCKSCRCENGTNGSAETVCHTEKCPQCGLGEQRQPAGPGQCCGTCKPSGCVVNGHVYKAGESINGSMHCFSKTCSYSAAFDAYIIKETQIECRTDNLPPCKGNTTEYDATGCCKTCVVKYQQAAHTCATCQPMLMFGNPASTIGYFSVINNGVKCENLDPIPDLKECSGYCQSRAKYTAIMRGFDNKCNCCQPTKTISKSVQLTCADGSVISKSYNVPENCGCSACSGGR